MQDIEREELRARIEKLEGEVALWRQRFHDAHAARGERWKACPLCEWPARAQLNKN